MRPAIAALVVVSLLAVAAPATAQTPPEERIRAGVTVSGVDVGNLTVAEATARLEQTLAPVLAQDVVVQAAGRAFRLKMGALKYDFRADRTALRALYAGQQAPPAADGTLPPAAATPSVAYKRKPVWRFVRRVAAAVGIAPRDAKLRIGLTRIAKVPGRKGRTMTVKPVVKAIEAALADPAAARAVAAKLKPRTPKIQTKELAKAYPTVITIDRNSFRLRLFKRLKIAKRYGVAVGMPEYPTPTGLFAIQTKQVNPTWTAPNSPWAGEMAGQQVAGGAADNPLKARWMGVSGSVGIHGTGQPWSIGTRASHGCIRMTESDVIDLFDRVAIGTPVLIR
jgi:lipoprotein-anchoring transpeptidase ErfK/SrfK